MKIDLIGKNEGGGDIVEPHLVITADCKDEILAVFEKLTDRLDRTIDRGTRESFYHLTPDGWQIVLRLRIVNPGIFDELTSPASWGTFNLQIKIP